MSAKEPDVFAKLNGYTISLNCNNPVVNRTNTLQQNVARMLFPVKDLMIHSFNTCLWSPCSVPDTEKVLGTQQWAEDPRPCPPRTDTQKGGQRETRHEQQTQGNCTCAVSSAQRHMCVPKNQHATQKQRTKDQRTYGGKRQKPSKNCSTILCVLNG